MKTEIILLVVGFVMWVVVVCFFLVVSIFSYCLFIFFFFIFQIFVFVVGIVVFVFCDFWNAKPRWEYNCDLKIVVNVGVWVVRMVALWPKPDFNVLFVCSSSGCRFFRLCKEVCFWFVLGSCDVLYVIFVIVKLIVVFLD